ncbi:hypothetical protein [Candidatus Uabimicrobium amorphum]|uniref:Uncharacterized protein n=1 Tax=Uabimicrobium amorphum TaxID=2596890 RepID=A0A5S9F4S6_UABAM|nr:hypothetical protein [Candidatus Uabimicrobium amorphum]BBM84909.1 hypothetical protein UABAM_03270 [Candidatus Uabimicrobium amorphum]
MAKKKNKNKKRSENLEETEIPQEKKSGITARLEKAKAIDVFEGMSPEKHVDELKEQVISVTAEQAEELKKNNRGFPWTEFLIGFVLGGALLIVMFVFHINFAKNVNKRIVNLENRLAMLSPEITSPDRDYLQIISQQQMFESELSRFKRKLDNFPRNFMIGRDSFQVVSGKTTKGKISFAKKFRKKPVVICQTSNSNLKCKVNIDETFSYFTYEVEADNVNEGMYSLFWMAGSED